MLAIATGIENIEDNMSELDKELANIADCLKVYVVSEIGTMWAFEVKDTLEDTAVLPSGSIIVFSYL